MLKKYYDILELEENATLDDIRSAYKRLAKKYHPDKNKGSEESEAKFKKINEAYMILTDPKKKSEYERGNNFDFGEDIFSSIFGHMFDQGDSVTEIEVIFSIKDLFEHEKLDITYSRKIKCKICNGLGGKDINKCSKCDGSGKIFHGLHDMNLFNSVSLCNTCFGTGQISRYNCNMCKGSGTEIVEEAIALTNVETINHGSYIRVSDGGNYNRRTKKYGILMLRLVQQNDSIYIKKGLNVAIKYPLPIHIWIIGGEIDIPTLHGDKKIKIDPIDKRKLSSPIVLNKSGFKNPSGNIGDQIISFYLDLPDHIGKQIIEKLRPIFNEIGPDSYNEYSKFLKRTKK
ncbi:MAG: J domain-containing protein [bacterium]|nr:J domain-containing protein [bacterium]